MSNTANALPPRHILEDRLTDQLVRIARVESVLTMTGLALDCEHSELTNEGHRDVLMTLREVLTDVREKLDVVNYFKSTEAAP